MLGLLRRKIGVTSPPQNMGDITTTKKYSASFPNAADEELNQEFSFLEKLAECVTVAGKDKEQDHNDQEEDHNVQDGDRSDQPEDHNEQGDNLNEVKEIQVCSCTCDNSGTVTCAHMWYSDNVSEPQTPECYNDSMESTGLLLCKDHIPDDDDDDDDDDEDGSVNDDETASMCSSGRGGSDDENDQTSEDDVDSDNSSVDDDTDGQGVPCEYTLKDFVKGVREADTLDEEQIESDGSSSGGWVSSEGEESPNKNGMVNSQTISKRSRKRTPNVGHQVRSPKYRRQGGMMVPVESEEDHWDDLDSFLNGLSTTAPPKKRNPHKTAKCDKSYGSYSTESEDCFFSFSGKPTGSTLGYAFPRSKPDEIDDIIAIWEMDYQVGERIAPKMGSWEEMGIVPKKEKDLKGWRRYVSYKNLYIRYVQCNKNKQIWNNRYWCKSLEQILLMKGNSQGSKRRADAVAHKGNYRTAGPKTVSYNNRLNHSCSIENDLDVSKGSSVLYSVC